MATPFPFKEQDLKILEQLQGLEARDHLPDNFVIFDYSSFTKESIDSFFACEFLSENFHVIIIAECGMLKVTFRNLNSEDYTLMPGVPSEKLRNVINPSDHIATLIMAHLFQYAKSVDRKAFYCLSSDKSFPVNTKIIDCIGDEFVYCCVIKSIEDFLDLKKFLINNPDDPVKMRLYRLLKNDVPRDDSDYENCGKIMFFHYGDKYIRKIGRKPWPVIKVQKLWQELKQFADNFHAYPLHISITTAFPSKRKDCRVSLCVFCMHKKKSKKDVVITTKSKETVTSYLAKKLLATHSTDSFGYYLCLCM